MSLRWNELPLTPWATRPSSIAIAVVAVRRAAVIVEPRGSLLPGGRPLRWASAAAEAYSLATRPACPPGGCDGDSPAVRDAAGVWQGSTALWRVLCLETRAGVQVTALGQLRGQCHPGHWLPTGRGGPAPKRVVPGRVQHYRRAADRFSRKPA
eukprot:scaffold781_cov394-Prasinococcus_capsulatus_cf.AAC.5